MLQECEPSCLHVCEPPVNHQWATIVAPCVLSERVSHQMLTHGDSGLSKVILFSTSCKLKQDMVRVVHACSEVQAYFQKTG